MTDLLAVALAGRIALALLAVVLARRHRAARLTAFGGSMLASIATGAMAVSVLRAGVPLQGVLAVHGASGLSLSYAVDGLSAWFLLVLAVLAIPIALFSIGYVGHPPFERRSAFVGAGFNVLLGAVELTFAAGDAITFLFAWELMTLATAALVTTEHEAAGSRRSAYLYLALSHIGTGCLIAGFLVVGSAAGSVSFAASFGRDLALGPMRDALFVLFFIGFGVKAGVIPLHVWLPEAHPAAPTNISAVMSAVVIKAGIYGIVRVCVFGLGTPSLAWGVAVVVIGGLSAVLGVLYALMQHDLKRLLAYHSIENIGIILLGLGAGMIGLSYGRSEVAAIGFAAGLYHVLNHAVFKGLLFLGAGAVVMTTGTRQIEAFGGLLRRMPWTGAFFLVGAMAISGLPPLNGFASEWLTFQAFLYGFRGSAEPLLRSFFPIAGALLALTTALAAACFVKAFGITFLALPRSTAAEQAHESPAVMLVPQAWLALCCVVLGLFPGAVLHAIDTVLAPMPGLDGRLDHVRGATGISSGLGGFDQVIPVILGAALLAGLGFTWMLAARAGRAVRRVPTWGCGGVLTPQTEYTATAFSKPLMMIFRSVYRPRREVEAVADVSPYFTQEVRYHADIEPTFERYVYGPLLRAILRIAAGLKVLQAGSLHAYLAYVIALVVILVLMVSWSS
jgi:hydrogenase-4 component B